MAPEPTETTPTLFSPIQIGKYQLSHRIVLAPLTRCRAVGGIPNAAMKEYYSQRATPGGLLITEATAISELAPGFPRVPGIYTDEHVEGWKPIVDAVHAKGGIIFSQLWHAGRATHPKLIGEGVQPISSTRTALPEKYKIYLPDESYDIHPDPRPLTIDEIPGIIDQFRRCALNAIKAGFDGVEIHSAHSYLIDQFLKDYINDRTDEYGGPLENRTRFLREVLDAVVSAVGPDRVAIRISPAINHLDGLDSNPQSLGLAVVDILNNRQVQWNTKLAYLHVTQPRTMQYLAANVTKSEKEEEEARMLKSWRTAYDGNFMSSGGYTPELAVRAVESGETDLVSFGRLFLANPDLVKRLRLNAPLNKYDRTTFYIADPVVGYTDYPFLEETPEAAA